MIAPPSYLYEVSSARAPEGFHSVKEEPQRKDFQVDFPFENPTGYKKPTARNLKFTAKSVIFFRVFESDRCSASIFLFPLLRTSPF